MKKIISVVFINKNQLKQTLLIMRLISYLLLASMLPTFATGYSQNTLLKFDEKPATLANVIETIENQTDYRIFYNTEQITLETPVNIDKAESTVADALKTSLEGSKISYKLLGQMIVLAPTEYINEVKKVTGIVTDDKGSTIPGVNVMLEGTNIGTTTDINGKFTIEVQPEGGVLVFTFIGYTTQKLAVKSGDNVTVTLQFEAIGLREVVVIGFGSRARKDVTTAISTVDSRTLSKVVTMNPQMAMQGRMTGVQVSGNSGNLMDKPVVRIRGVNTWGVADPLYVVDGIPLQSTGDGISGEQGLNGYLSGPLNIMSMINPDDIESISVLKDASAAAIYGVRAANGVILITTKKGSGDKPRLEFNTRFGIQNMAQHIDVLDTKQYTKHLQDLYATDPTYTVDPLNAPVIDPTNTRYLGNSKTYDWQNELKNQNAPLQEYSMRVFGGTNKTDYFLSLGYSTQEGTFKGNNLDRYNASIKINTQINNWLRTGVNYRLSSIKGINDVDGLEMNYAKLSQAPPWQPVRDINGPFGFAQVVPGIQPDGSYDATALFGAGTQWNYAGQMAVSDWDYNSLRNMGNAYFEIEPLKDLKIRGTISMDANTRHSSQYQNSFESLFCSHLPDPREEGGGNSAGTLEEHTVNDFNLVQELSLNYKKSYGDHNFDFLLNAMSQQVNGKLLSVRTTYTTTANPDLRVIPSSEFTQSESYLSRSALTGTMARVGYNYQSKYYLDATVRRDGSSNFAPDYRYGVFPSVSAAWRISAESFMKQYTWLTDLKLRAGYGKLGNQEVKPLAYLSPIYTNSVYAFGTTENGVGNPISGATIYSIPTENLQWEETSTANIGIDAVIINNLSFSLEYYNKLTKGLLQTMSLPLSTGVKEFPSANVGSVRNSGIEISLNYGNKVGEFTYSVGGNFTTVKNVVEETYNHIPLWNVEEGYSMFYIKGFKVNGIFQNQAEVDAWTAKYTDENYKIPAPGDVFFQDLRGPSHKPGEFYTNTPDSVINAYDQVNLGNTIPRFYYGLNINMAWKGIDLAALLTGVGGVYKFNDLRANLEYSPSEGNNLSPKVLDAWTPQNQSATVPRLIVGDPNSNFRYSDMFVEKAGYLRLTTLQIGYSLPSKVYDLTNKSISYIRIYAAATNLFTITPYSGLDPENDYYPSPRIFSLGLNVNF